MRELLDPRHDNGINVVIDRPLKPLVRIGFAYCERDNTVTAMRLQVVTDPIGTQVARKKHNRVRVNRHIAQARISNLKHGVKHVLDRIETFGVLVKHGDDGLAQVNLEPAIWVVLSDFSLVVNDGHRNIAQVHVGYINIGNLVVREGCAQGFE